MKNYNEANMINVGTGEDLTIKDLALLIKKVIGFEGDLVFDLSRPDGTPRKLLDVSKLHSKGWNHEIELEQGIKMVYHDFIMNHA
jgi:GDP-L-fucose synthase